jgi:hypothetical protein
MAYSRQQLSAIKTRMNAERLSRDLTAFVRAAWPILEPTTPLAWNWHLDLICEHLTAIKENRFRAVFGPDAGTEFARMEVERLDGEFNWKPQFVM